MFKSIGRSKRLEANEASCSIFRALGELRNRTTNFRRDEKGTVAIIFGLTQIVWFAWLGIAMLRQSEPAAQAVDKPAFG